MTTLADQTIAALRTGHDRLAARVERFGPDDLARRSGASEWAVAQVLSHLGSGAEIALATLDGALADVPARDQSANQEVWARWNAMSPVEQATGFVAASRALVERYESLDERARADLRINLGFLPQPVDLATAGALRLSEFTLHTWDVEVAFDDDAVLAAEAVPLLLDPSGALLGWTGHPDEVANRPATVAVHLVEPARSFGLRLADTASLTDLPEQPDGELHAPAESWLRLLAGRLSPTHTPKSVTTADAPVDLDTLRRVFRGY
jgi:uncharacterized protein (TIGR03083 family)